MDKQTIRVGKVTVPNPAVAQTITLGFKPRYVKAYSVNNLTIYEHFYGMDAGTSLNTANSASTQISVNTDNGITLTTNGFTLGTDICDTAADVVYWLATR